METEIDALEEWARGHARFASSEIEKESNLDDSVVNRLRDLN
jgi:hypothetical protein